MVVVVVVVGMKTGNIAGKKKPVATANRITTDCAERRSRD